MIASKVVRRQFPLAIISAAEFARPDHEGIVQHAATFQIVDERRRRLVGFAALRFDACRQVAVLVPALVIKLDEPHAAFRQPPSEQTIGGKGSGRLRIGPVFGKRTFGSSLTLTTSGIDVCIRNPSSYWAIRVSICGSVRSASCNR